MRITSILLILLTSLIVILSVVAREWEFVLTEATSLVAWIVVYFQDKTIRTMKQTIKVLKWRN